MQADQIEQEYALLGHSPSHAAAAAQYPVGLSARRRQLMNNWGGLGFNRASIPWISQSNPLLNMDFDQDLVGAFCGDSNPYLNVTGRMRNGLGMFNNSVGSLGSVDGLELFGGVRGIEPAWLNKVAFTGGNNIGRDVGGFNQLSGLGINTGNPLVIGDGFGGLHQVS